LKGKFRNFESPAEEKLRGGFNLLASTFQAGKVGRGLVTISPPLMRSRNKLGSEADWATVSGFAFLDLFFCARAHGHSSLVIRHPLGTLRRLTNDQ
jgi:hypothetical protein